MNDKLIAVSLFSSSGIGDLGLQANGIDTVIANELLPQRMQLFLHNHHETKGFCGDIWKMKDEIVSYYKDTFETSPFLLIATPPCQGMSSNGMGPSETFATLLAKYSPIMPLRFLMPRVSKMLMSNFIVVSLNSFKALLA